MLSSQKYDAKFDYIKLFLSIMVLAIHCMIYPTILFPWLRIAVPLFFIISSYFLFSKLKHSDDKQQYQLLKKYFLRNFRLYSFWFVILLPITLYVRKDLYFSPNITTNIFHFLRSLFFDSTFIASWYITASVLGVFIIFLLSKKLSTPVLLVITTIAFCLVTIFSSYQTLLSRNPFVFKIIHWYTTLLGSPVFSFPAALFWLFIGKCFAEDKIKEKSTKFIVGLIIISAIGLYTEWSFVRIHFGSLNNDSYFMLAPLCIGLFMGIQKINPITSKYANNIRRMSTVIYVSHGSIRFAINKFFFVNSNFIIFLITFCCSIFLYLAMEFITQHTKNKTILSILKCAM